LGAGNQPRKELVGETIEQSQLHEVDTIVSPLLSPPVGEKDKEDTQVQRDHRTKRKLTSQAIANSLHAITSHPIAKYHKFSVVSYNEGSATTKAVFSDARLSRPSSKYEVHSILGSTYYLLDVTCFVALLMQLREGESAITQDIHVDVMTPVPQGSEVIVKGKVLHIKENLVFVDGEVWFQGKPVIVGRVIKSLTESNVVALKEGLQQTKNE